MIRNNRLLATGRGKGYPWAVVIDRVPICPTLPTGRLSSPDFDGEDIREESGFLIQAVGKLFREFELRSTGKWFVLSTLIGIVAGLGAIVFQHLSQVVIFFALVSFSGYAPDEAAGENSPFEVSAEETAVPSIWRIVGVMALGGLASGFLVYTFAPEAEGHGTDAAIEAFHHKRGMIRKRIPLIKTLASAITMGTGGSGGREGPIAQIGAGFGSFLATRLNLSARDRRIMLAAGMGAGVGAIFRAPLAGALFAGEILYSEAEIESDAIIPAAISSVVAYSVFCFSLPPEKRFMPLFGRTIDLMPIGPAELIPFTLMALVLVLVGFVYIKVFYGTHAIFQKLPIKPHFRPAIGATLAGLIAAALYFATAGDRETLSVLSTGYGALQHAIDPSVHLTIGMLLLIAAAKIVTTSLTISSGGSGGVFGPSMVIGGCVGAAIGQYFHAYWPDLAPSEPQVYAIVGMAGFFAGCAHAPISTIMMVSEMTGSYSLLLPALWVSTICFLMSRRWKLYEKQLPTRLESPAHRGDFIVDVLEGIKVDDVYRRDTDLIYINESTSLDEIVHTLTKTHQHYFPVVDNENRMVGIFSSDDVRAYLYDETIWHLAVARDIMVTNVLSVSPQDDLNVALTRFTALNLDELPVLDAEDSHKLLGMLRRKETIAFYNRQLAAHKQSGTE